MNVLFFLFPLNLGLRQYLWKCFEKKKGKKPSTPPFAFPSLFLPHPVIPESAAASGGT